MNRILNGSHINTASVLKFKLTFINLYEHVQYVSAAAISLRIEIMNNVKFVKKKRTKDKKSRILHYTEKDSVKQKHCIFEVQFKRYFL